MGLSDVRWKVVFFWDALFFFWYTSGWFQEKLADILHNNPPF